MRNNKEYLLINPLDKKIICTHPEVKKVWQTGYISKEQINDRFFVSTLLELNSGQIKKFESDDPQKSIDSANKFLNTIQ